MITIFRNFTETKSPHYITVTEAVKRIREGRSKPTIDKVRNGDIEAKKSLPCVLFSGKFTSRSNAGLVQHSGFMVLDFDHSGAGYKEFLKSLPYIYATWISPSGNGVKALVKISDPSKHLGHFLSIAKELPELDTSGKDPARICFESYDPHIHVNEDAEVYTGIIEMPTYKPVQATYTETDEDKIYYNLKRWAERRGELFIEGNRNNFIAKLASAMNRTGISEDKAIQYLIYDFAHAGSDFGINELTRTVHSIYQRYGSQYGTMRFEKKDDEQIIVDQDGKETLHAFDGEVEVQDVIYFSQVFDSLMEMRTKGITKGESTHFPTVDNFYRWMRGEITCLYGFGNVGKSAFMTQLQLVKSVRDGYKWAVFSPENFPVEFYYRDILQAYFGKHFTELSDLQMEEGRDFINDHFFYIYPKNESPTPDLILKRFTEMIIKHKIDGVLIDPFNQLDNDWGKSGRDDKYLEKVLTQFKRFAQNHNIFFHICAHPTKPSRTKNGEFQKLTIYDLAGGAMWANKMDNILLYDRPDFFTNPTSTNCEFSSQKIKKQQINGTLGTTTLTFERKEFRFYDQGYNPLGGRKVIYDSHIEPNYDESPF